MHFGSFDSRSFGYVWAVARLSFIYYLFVILYYLKTIFYLKTSSHSLKTAFPSALVFSLNGYIFL